MNHMDTTENLLLELLVELLRISKRIGASSRQAGPGGITACRACGGDRVRTSWGVLRCAPCHAKQVLSWRRKNPDKARAAQKKHNAKRRAS